MGALARRIRSGRSLSKLDSALVSLVRFLDSRKVPYMVIGGIAGLAWGRQRATFDIDITLWAARREGELLAALAQTFPPRVPDPEAFVGKTRVLPVSVGGVNADLIFGQLLYEEAAILRARPIQLAGATVRVCTPEDLIAHKIISERDKDREDVRELIALRAVSLDRGYLDPLIRSLSDALSRADIWESYLSCFQNPGSLR